MVQFSQIYKKAVVLYSLLIVMSLMLFACASKTTDLFGNRNVMSEEQHLFIKPVSLEIEQTCTYYLSVLNSSEFDRFESNIFDQLRVSLYSEARYKYPEYELLNLSQNEKKTVFRTRYTVKADLVLKKSMQKKLDLLVNHTNESTPPNSVDSRLKEQRAADVRPDTAPTALENNEVPELNPSIDVGELVNLFEDAKSNTSSKIKEIKSTKEDVREPLVLDPITTTEEAAPNVPDDSRSLNLDELSLIQQDDKNRNNEKVVPPSTARVQNGQVVFIVACFQKEGFVEEKVWITEEEIGHPLKYYVTDKWIRVYLSDVRSSQEAKSIYFEAWPCRYGR